MVTVPSGVYLVILAKLTQLVLCAILTMTYSVRRPVLTNKNFTIAPGP